MPSEWIGELPRPAARLEREIELGPVRLRLSEWSGRRGPVVWLPDPLEPTRLCETLGLVVAPEWRVLQLAAPSSVPYQAQATDTLALLDAFGFERSVLVGHGLSGAVALVLAAWYPSRLAGLVLVDGGGPPPRAVRQRLSAAAAEQPCLRGLLDATPRWGRLQRQVACPTLLIRTSARPARLDARARRALRRGLPESTSVRAAAPDGLVRAVQEFLDSRVQSGACW